MNYKIKRALIDLLCILAMLLAIAIYARYTNLL